MDPVVMGVVMLVPQAIFAAVRCAVDVVYVFAVLVLLVLAGLLLVGCVVVGYVVTLSVRRRISSVVAGGARRPDTPRGVPSTRC
jgi:hypothetical protein